MFKLQNTIDKFTSSHLSIQRDLLQLKKLINNETELWILLDNKNDDFFCHGDTFDFLADFLQLTDDRTATYNLDDIEQIYRLLVNFYPNNFQ